MAIDTSPLPYPKTDKIPVPANEDPRQYIQAYDWNTLCAVVDSIRDEGGGGGGGTTQTIDVINATAATNKQLTAAVANSGTNVAFIFNNSTTLAGTTSLASFRNNGSEKLSIDNSGAVLAPAILVLSGTTGGTYSLTQGSDGASAKALTVTTSTSWSNAGARLASFQNFFSEVLGIDPNGQMISSWARAIGTAQTAGITLANTTPASSGNQQYSPAIVLEGQGYKTNTAAASQSAQWGIQVRPVQGTANPTADLTFTQNINGAGHTVLAALRSNGNYAGGAGSIPITYWVPSTGGAFGYTNSTGDIRNGMFVINDSVSFLYSSGIAQVSWTDQAFNSQADGYTALGSAATRWKSAFAGYYDTKQGAQLTAAATITPTTGLHHVTGATTIDTIAITNLPGNAGLKLVADGGTITVSAAGNVATAFTITQDKMQGLVYDATASKWYPQQ